MATAESEGLWQHVAQLRPSLRKHVRVLAQDYRGERFAFTAWRHAQDRISGNDALVEFAARSVSRSNDLPALAAAADQPRCVKA